MVLFRSMVEGLAFMPPPFSGYTNGDEYTWIDGGEGTMIPVCLVRNETTNPSDIYILYSHGNSEDLNLNEFALHLLSQRLQVNLVGYDYTGYGSSRSYSRPSEAAACKNIEAVYHWLITKQGVREDRIILLGKSIGSGPTVHLAALKPKLLGVILQSAFLSVVRVVTRISPLDWLGDIFINQAKIGRVRHPVLFVHGRSDSVVPFHHGLRLFELYRSRNCSFSEQFSPLWIAGADHNDIEVSFEEPFMEAMQDFIAKLLVHEKRKSKA